MSYIHSKLFIEHTIINLKRAIRENNPDLTLAIFVNLLDVLPSHVEGLHNEITLDKQIANRRAIKLKGKMK